MHRRPQFLRRDAFAAAAVLILGLLLALSGRLLWDGTRRNPDLVSASPGPGVGEPRLDSLLGLGASAVGLVVVAWWLVTMSLAIASALLEAAGRHGVARWAGAVAPVFMRRLAYAVLGLGIVAGPAAHASSGDLDPAWHPTSAEAIHDVPSAIHGPFARTDAPSEPAPAATTRPLPQAAWTPPSSAPIDVLPSRGPLVRAELRPVGGPQGAVEVRPGDSLWSIASRHLGPGATPTDVAEAWPLWFEANRAAIGDDPDLIRPGVLLAPPDG